MPNTPLILLACALTALGTLSLYGAWRGAGGRWLTPVGWCLVLAAIPLWVQALGPEFGLAYGLLALGTAAWMLVLYNYETRASRQRELSSETLLPPHSSTILRHLALALLTIPVSALASAYFCVGLSSLLGWHPANAIFLVILVMPLVWGLAAYWLTADPNRWRPVLGVVAAGLLGAALVYN